MVYIGKNIVLFFKPFIEQAKIIRVACLVADSSLFLKWAKNLQHFELFVDKAKVIHKRANEFHRIKNLHAKIYCFDDSIFLSSANLTYGSLFTNIEHAVELTNKTDKKKILTYLERLRNEEKK